ncbi:predicted protein [Uncinocarpus reesii 1704]|uniref:Uncharacterized protein n=1 Tax=Uncinocarpus reesii (strain UAMH 1704) TaxID=336963 RepID=C4JKT8_UNCRE|nr:uncharacterized protein UREG_00153 [Uncinocarpus reesii 1704]EEP75307.1 predicted protein [Uncinocarpus reesii 1704]
MLNSRQARWVENLAAYDFTLEHRLGACNPADAPSQQPDYKLTDMQEHQMDMLPILQCKLALEIVKSENPYKKPADLWQEARPGAGTSCLESLIPRIIVIEAQEDENVYGSVSGSMGGLLCKLQNGDAWSAELCVVLNSSTESAFYWQAG